MEVTALLAASFILICLFLFRQRRGTPPGPIGFPILGYLPVFTSKPYVVLQKLSEKYGPVFSIRLGSRYVIVLNDFKSTQDAFVQDALMGRPPVSPFHRHKATLETGAINGLAWKEQRRFSLHILKDLGFGNSNMQDKMKAEIEKLLEHFEKTCGRSVSPRNMLSPSVSNNIAMLMYGKRHEYDDPVQIVIDKPARKSEEDDAGQLAWENFFPWFSKLLQFLPFGKQWELNEVRKESRLFRENEVEEHKKTLDEHNIRDYIDGYLVEIQKRKDPAFCEKVLEDLIGTFFGAGSEPARQTLDWLMLAMAAYPGIQQKVQSEIDDIVGRDSLPTLKHQHQMPYTQASIMEVMRWRTVIPINVLRYTLWDTELNGYFIPKETIVVANLWAVHHDSKYWGEDVDDFRPERFLIEDGKNVAKPEYFIPFSIGKRACPGESYARMEVFLYFVSILQRFSISFPEGASPDFEGELGIGLNPKPYKVCLTKRY